MSYIRAGWPSKYVDEDTHAYVFPTDNGIEFMGVVNGVMSNADFIYMVRTAVAPFMDDDELRELEKKLIEKHIPEDEQDAVFGEDWKERCLNHATDYEKLDEKRKDVQKFLSEYEEVEDDGNS